MLEVTVSYRRRRLSFVCPSFFDERTCTCTCAPQPPTPTPTRPPRRPIAHRSFLHVSVVQRADRCICAHRSSSSALARRPCLTRTSRCCCCVLTLHPRVAPAHLTSPSSRHVDRRRRPRDHTSTLRRAPDLAAPLHLHRALVHARRLGTDLVCTRATARPEASEKQWLT